MQKDAPFNWQRVHFDRAHLIGEHDSKPTKKWQRTVGGGVAQMSRR
jgi:hypothetical protein